MELFAVVIIFIIIKCLMNIAQEKSKLSSENNKPETEISVTSDKFLSQKEQLQEKIDIHKDKINKINDINHNFFFYTIATENYFLMKNNIEAEKINLRFTKYNAGIYSSRDGNEHLFRHANIMLSDIGYIKCRNEEYKNIYSNVSNFFSENNEINVMKDIKDYSINTMLNSYVVDNDYEKIKEAIEFLTEEAVLNNYKNEKALKDINEAEKNKIEKEKNKMRKDLINTYNNLEGNEDIETNKENKSDSKVIKI